MDSSIIIAIISLIGTLGGSFLGVFVSAKLTNYRLQQLESEVVELSGGFREIPVLKEQIAELRRRADTMEQKLDALVNSLEQE